MRETTHSLTTDLGDVSVVSLMAELASPSGEADPYPIYRRLRDLGGRVRLRFADRRRDRTDRGGDRDPRASP